MVSLLDEHHGYLSLADRSEIYGAAIEALLRSGDVVADLGCGVGVLGLQCLQAGAARAYGIDYSDAIELARETMARAGLSDRYTCIRNSTYRAQLPEQVDLIICDHVGYFGFDYGIVEMMADARRRLLKPGGRTIPQAVAPVVAGVSSAECLEQASWWAEDDFPEEYRWLNTYARNTKHTAMFKPDDLCSAPVTLGSVRLDREDGEASEMAGTLVATRDCRFDGLGGWFECEMAPGVTMTNSPLAEPRIDRNHVFLPCEQAFDVKAGDEIAVALRFRHDGEMIAWDVTPPGGAPRQRMSTWKSKVLTPADLVAEKDTPLSLNPTGTARRVILSLVDGTRSAAEIEALVMEQHNDLFPNSAELRRFVRRELGHAAQ